jgi:hypothetical protein
MSWKKKRKRAWDRWKRREVNSSFFLEEDEGKKTKKG